jgi:hypothetical protein
VKLRGATERHRGDLQQKIELFPDSIAFWAVQKKRLSKEGQKVCSLHGRRDDERRNMSSGGCTLPYKYGETSFVNNPYKKNAPENFFFHVKIFLNNFLKL